MLSEEISSHLTRSVTGSIDLMAYLRKSNQDGCKLALQVIEGSLFDLSLSQLKTISKSIQHNDFPKLVACATLSYSIFLAMKCPKLSKKIDSISDDTPDGAYFAMMEDYCYQSLVAHGFSDKSAQRHSYDARSVYLSIQAAADPAVWSLS